MPATSSSSSASRVALPHARYYLSDPDDESYGLSPPRFAPTPQSRWRPLFDDGAVDAHLDRLAGTLTNLRVLRAYGRA
jgi:hypothetical protein